VHSLLHSRGTLAGAGSALSLIAAALASMIFAAGLIGFTAWPAGSGSSVQSVVVPSAPAGAGTLGGGARALAVAAPAVVLPAARVPARRGPVRTVVRPATGGGSAPTATATAPAAPSPATATPAPVTAPAPPSVTRQITSGLAGTTTAVTHQVGSTVGGPVGGAVQSTGDTVAQTLDDVGSATQSLLGG
jgi:hypothetical protein